MPRRPCLFPVTGADRISPPHSLIPVDARVKSANFRSRHFVPMVDRVQECLPLSIARPALRQPALVQLLRDEFKGYNQVSGRRDLIAGLTVAAVALPLALAFGVAS